MTAQAAPSPAPQATGPLLAVDHLVQRFSVPGGLSLVAGADRVADPVARASAPENDAAIHRPLSVREEMALVRDRLTPRPPDLLPRGIVEVETAGRKPREIGIRRYPESP